MKKHFGFTRLLIAVILLIVLTLFTFVACDRTKPTDDPNVIPDNPSLPTTQNLAYEASPDGSYYILTGTGTSAATEIVIPAEYNGKPVKAIGESAFQGCISLTGITIPNSVTSIGDSAFSWCVELTSITIPNSVTSIGVHAFSSSGLTSITIGSGVTSIGERAFSNTAWYNNQPDGMVYAGKVAYKYKGTMPENTSITLKADTVSISPYAFSGCSGLTSITIGNSVTGIGYDAFWGCSGLTGVYISDLAAWCNITFSDISANPLYNAAKLYLNNELVTELTIPNTITEIKAYAFYDYSSLTSVTIGSGVTTIGNEAFRNCSGLTSITIPNSVTSIGNYAFNGCNITSATMPTTLISSIPKDNLQTVVINGGTSIGERAFLNCSGLTSVTIPDSVTSIGQSAFLNCSGLTSITIPDSVTSIGQSAFLNCSGLTSITIPDSVTSIGNGAFVNCSSLTTVNWNATNCTTAGSSSNYIFSGSTSLTTVVIGNNVQAIPAYAFNNCGVLTSITIPSSVTTIGNEAFRYCRLTSITIPSSVTSIGEYAFDGCNITSATMPTTLISSIPKSNLQTVIINGGTSIGNSAFSDCSSLTSITIGNSVISIGNYAFYNCRGLTSVTIPDSVTSIGEYAFNNCSSLTSITIPNSVTNIGKYAFYDCSALQNIIIPPNVETIGLGAFYGCKSLRYVWFGYTEQGYDNIYYTAGGKITALPEYCFSGCERLKFINIVLSVTSIEPFAFENCVGLLELTLPETLQTIKSVGTYTVYKTTAKTVPEGWDLSGRPILLDSKNADVDTNYSDGNKYAVWYKNADSDDRYLTGFDKENAGFNADFGAMFAIKDGKATLFRVTNFEGEYIIPKTIKYPGWIFDNTADVTSIDSNAFRGCNGLTGITISDTVASIGYQAFSYCSGLTTINVSADNANYASQDGILYNKAKTQIIQAPQAISGAVTIPNGVTSIGNYAFYNCTGLTSITIPDSVTSIGGGAFYGTAWYNNQPDGMIYAGKVAYKYKGTMPENTSITLKSDTVGIADSAFSYRNGLTSVTIPDSVTSIGNGAFAYCSSLTSITIPNSVTSIGEWAFSWCGGLTSVTFANTTGWYVTETAGAASGTAVDVTDIANNATMLKETYRYYYWYRR